MRLVSSRFCALVLCLAQAPARIGSRAQGHSYPRRVRGQFIEMTSGQYHVVACSLWPSASASALALGALPPLRLARRQGEGPRRCLGALLPGGAPQEMSRWSCAARCSAPRLLRWRHQAKDHGDRRAQVWSVTPRLQRLGLGRVPPRAAEYPGGIRAYHPGGIRAYHPGLAVPADDEPQRPTKPAAAQACDHGVVEPPAGTRR